MFNYNTIIYMRTLPASPSALWFMYIFALPTFLASVNLTYFVFGSSWRFQVCTYYIHTYYIYVLIYVRIHVNACLHVLMRQSDLLLFMWALLKTSFLLSCQFQAINWPLTWNSSLSLKLRVCLKRHAFHWDAHRQRLSNWLLKSCCQLHLQRFIPCN